MSFTTPKYSPPQVGQIHSAPIEELRMNVSALRSLFGESNAAISGSVVAKSLIPFSTRLLAHTGQEASPTLQSGILA